MCRGLSDLHRHTDGVRLLLEQVPHFLPHNEPGVDVLLPEMYGSLQDPGPHHRRARDPQARDEERQEGQGHR